MGEHEEQIVARLVSKLKDEDEEVRKEAVATSWRIRGGEFVAPLLAAIETERDSDTYFRLLRMLANCGDRWAIAPLFAIIINKEAPSRMRYDILEALAALDPGIAVELAISLLKDNNGLHYVAVQTLGELSNENSFLQRRYAPDRDLHAEMLNALGNDSSERIIDVLIAALEDKNGDVRTEAVRALGKIGSQKAVPWLIATAKGPYEAARYPAIEALSKCGEAGIQALIALLEDKDKLMRTRAALVLGGLGYKQAMPVLTEALEDEAISIQAQATVLLAQMDAAFRPRAIEMLNSPESKVREQTAIAMGLFPNEREVDLLAEHVRDMDANAGLLAAWALMEVDQSRLMTLLHEMLQSEDINMRRRAAFVLDGSVDVKGFGFAHLMRGPQAIAELRPLLKDDDWEVRLAAIVSIGRHEQEPTHESEVFIAGLKDKSSVVRAEVAGWIDSPEANDILIGLLNDESAQVRESAAAALSRLGDEQALPALLSMIENDDGRGLTGKPISDVAKKAVTLIKTREYILTGKEL